MGFPGGSDGKESACNSGDLRSIPALGRSSAEGKWQPTLVSLAGEFQVGRDLGPGAKWNPQRTGEAKEGPDETRGIHKNV